MPTQKTEAAPQVRVQAGPGAGPAEPGRDAGKDAGSHIPRMDAVRGRGAVGRRTSGLAVGYDRAYDGIYLAREGTEAFQAVRLFTAVRASQKEEMDTESRAECDGQPGEAVRRRDTGRKTRLEKATRWQALLMPL